MLPHGSKVTHNAPTVVVVPYRHGLQQRVCAQEEAGPVEEHQAAAECGEQQAAAKPAEGGGTAAKESLTHGAVTAR